MSRLLPCSLPISACNLLQILPSLFRSIKFAPSNTRIMEDKKKESTSTIQTEYETQNHICSSIISKFDWASDSINLISRREQILCPISEVKDDHCILLFPFLKFLGKRSLGSKRTSRCISAQSSSS